MADAYNPDAPHKEEHSLELEALECLYINDEFKKTSDSSFTLSLIPHVENVRSKKVKGNSNIYVSCVLSITYTNAYPDEPPLWKLKQVKGLDEEQQSKLVKEINECIESSIGMAMVYSIAEIITAFLTANNAPKQSMHDEMMKRAKDAAGSRAGTAQQYEENDTGDEDDSDERLQDENKYDHNEFKGLLAKNLVCPDMRVTEANFLIWAKKFRESMIAEEKWKGTSTTNKEGLSGRELFEKDHNLINFDIEDDIDNENDIDDDKSRKKDRSHMQTDDEAGSHKLFWTNAELFDANIDDIDCDG